MLLFLDYIHFFDLTAPGSSYLLLFVCISKLLPINNFALTNNIWFLRSFPFPLRAGLKHTNNKSFYNSHERVGVEKGESIQEHYHTQSSSWNQQLGVPAQPQVIQSHLLSKIGPVGMKHTARPDATCKHINTPVTVKSDFFLFWEKSFPRHLGQCYIQFPIHKGTYHTFIPSYL